MRSRVDVEKILAKLRAEHLQIMESVADDRDRFVSVATLTSLPPIELQPPQPPTPNAAAAVGVVVPYRRVRAVAGKRTKVS
jgi:hypothetical protein